MTENIDPNDIEDCQKQVFDLEAEVRELRAALGRAANDLMLSEESFVTMRAKRDEVLSELRTTRAALERARALLADIQWDGNSNGTLCPACNRFQLDGHRPGCDLAALLAAASGGAA